MVCEFTCSCCGSSTAAAADALCGFLAGGAAEALAGFSSRQGFEALQVGLASHNDAVGEQQELRRVGSQLLAAAAVLQDS
ncbi:hypothetical protein OEZ86_010612 [Tetradesmus obliquus]|nr:hypothetical protein OEZ86_010612 [Tetradesmus obliquus]